MATLKTDNIDSTSGGNVKFIKNLDVGDGSTAKNAHVYGTLQVDDDAGSGTALTLDGNLGMGSNDITCGDVTGSAGVFNSMTVGGVSVNTGPTEQGLVLLDKIGSTSSFQTGNVNFATDGTGSGEVDYSDYSDFVLMVYDFRSQSTITNVTWQFKRGSSWYDLAQVYTYWTDTNPTSAKFETMGLKQNATGSSGYSSFVQCLGYVQSSSGFGGNQFSNQGVLDSGADIPNGMRMLRLDHNLTTAITGMRLEKTGTKNWKGIFRLYGMIAETT